ncbi:MAG: hydroxymethylglutaryl-CoA reductase, degradative [Candidatus Lokiarchaeota archaeon]
MRKINSKLSGFYKLPIEERQKKISDVCDLNEDDMTILKNFGYFDIETADRMIENVVGSFQLPYGIACNFMINNQDYLIPMVTEEPSVVAAASNAARIARKQGGFQSDEVKSVMISQIQITDIPDIDLAKKNILNEKLKILNHANEQDPLINKLGGGAIDINLREIEIDGNKMLILHLLVNVLDAMGANVVNTMAEALSPLIEELTGGKVYLRIVSNLAIHRLARCKAVFDKDLLGGEEVVDAIIKAYKFAKADPYRAATHNKGIMNGITALTLATGNDTRAIEAGAHAYASINGKYGPLTKYTKDENNNLVGEIEIPLAFGIIGGMTKTHPMAQLSLKILNIESANELSQVGAALGLAQNLAALRALVSEGIQKGHMALHSRNIAKMAGIPNEYIEQVAKILVEDGKIRVDYAKEVFNKLFKK